MKVQQAGLGGLLLPRENAAFRSRKARASNRAKGRVRYQAQSLSAVWLFRRAYEDHTQLGSRKGPLGPKGLNLLQDRREPRRAHGFHAVVARAERGGSLPIARIGRGR